MGLVRFYRLSSSPLAAVLPRLLEKALEAGLRAVVRVGPGASLEALDTALWTYDEAAFLPHGRADAPHAARQPVLLTAATEAPNVPDILMLVGGAGAETDELAAHDRAFLIFDGEDPAALDAARGDWRRVVAAGLPAEFWAEDAGRWRMERRSD